jgi:hypothetical protein
MLAGIGRLDDEDFTGYGVSPEYVAAPRQRVADWRTGLARN